MQAPSYVELINLVKQQSEQSLALQAEVEALRIKIIVANVSDPVVVLAAVAAPTMRLEYRVVPDLNRAMTIFTGDESPLQVEDWLEEIKSMTTLNRWPFEYVLQYVRMHLTGPTKDWFTGREFSDWHELERKFRLVFVRDACAADREDEMRARKQGPTETLISYMQPKLRMCRGIGHSFVVSKDYVLRGLRSREMALYAVGRTHAGEEELLGHKASHKPVCFGCGVEGHIRPTCPEKEQTNFVEVRPVTSSHAYKKVGLVNNREVEVMLDTGSHHSLIKASVTIRCDLRVKPSARPLYGIGSTTVSSVCAVGEVETNVVLDGVNPGKVLLLVVPDAIQAPDMIVGRSWLNHPSVAYHKAHGCLYIYDA